MTKEALVKQNLPDNPGVYFFLGAKKQILYIGKATSLKSRVKSYFAKNLKEARSTLIEQMVAEAAGVEYTATDSVLEALILETNLIRTHKPKYNTRSKDDKSYNHLIITNEEWPRVLVVRGKDLTEQFLPKDIKYHFGPFPSGSLLREALHIIRKLFRFYDTKRPLGTERSKVVKGKIDFNRQIGLYPEEGDKAGYDRTIRHLRLFFEGKKTKILSELKRDMMAYAKAERFEEAHIAKKQIFALEHIEDVALIKYERENIGVSTEYRIEAYDVAHLQGEHMVGVMAVVVGEETRPSEYRKFKIASVSDANDPAALREMLRRRFTHIEWPFPHLVVVDGNEVQKQSAELILRECGLMIPVVAVTKNLKHKPERVVGPASVTESHQLAILLANSEAHRFAITYYRQKHRKQQLS
jgi:excinuclease ABC subunit C